MASSLQSIRYKRGQLEVVDQLKIPNELTYIQVKSCEDAWRVIRTMQVRGAPLIAITAILSIAIEAYDMINENKCASVDDASKYFSEKLLYLQTSRPTAVNLFKETNEMSSLILKITKDDKLTVLELLEKIISAAEKVMEEDIEINRAIGRHGAKRILELTGRDEVSVLTICNTGSLATAGYGTALGVVRALHEMGALKHVYACETRPYNQGSRLTAFEIEQDKLPGTLIADSMASSLMVRKGNKLMVYFLFGLRSS